MGYPADEPAGNGGVDYATRTLDWPNATVMSSDAVEVVARLKEESRTFAPGAREDTMRTLAITENITVDGSIEMLKDWFDPKRQGDIDMDDVLEEQQRQSKEADALLVGRRTFEAFREYWPRQIDDTTGISSYLNQVQKYVVSSTLTDPAWANTTVLSGDPVEKVAALKHGAGNDIVLTGSITLAHALIEAGLVDEYRLFAYPTVQGSGRRLFPDGYEVSRLRLLDSKAFRSGIVLQRYARG